MVTHKQSLEDTALSRRIFHAITSHPERSISFADYMEICLYDPEAGYYAHPTGRPIGREGDFFTSVSVGATYGYLLSLALLERWRDDLGRPDRLVVVEQGAHDGRLAGDILAGLAERRAAGIPGPGQVRYVVHEPDPGRRQSLENASRQWSHPYPGDFVLEVVGDGPAQPFESGVYLCNELLDAFPVHCIRWQSGRWVECRVGLVGDGVLGWVESAIAAESDLAEAVVVIPTDRLPDGYTTELCLGYEPWVAQVVRWFRRGLWWIVDYGFEAADFYDPARTEGTLRGYRDHRRTDDPFEAPGETDLTTDVDFTRLDRAACRHRLRRRQFTDQHHFLIAAAAPWLLEIESGGAEKLAAERQRLRQFQTLTHPGLMGRAFKIAEYDRPAD